jgi:hypothetical protein
MMLAFVAGKRPTRRGEGPELAYSHLRRPCQEFNRYLLYGSASPSVFAKSPGPRKTILVAKETGAFPHVSFDGVYPQHLETSEKVYL